MKSVSKILMSGAGLLFIMAGRNISYAQQDLFKDVLLFIDTSVYSIQKNVINLHNREHLYFYYHNNDEEVQLHLIPASDVSITKLSLYPSGDYVIVDSLLFFNKEYYTLKVRFSNITRSNFLSFRFKAWLADRKEAIDYELPLYPVTLTKINFYPATDDLFIGEEKVFDLLCDNPDNIKLPSEWTKGLDIDYFVSMSEGKLKLYLQPHSAGKKTLQLKLQTYKPFLNSRNQSVYDLPPLTYQFNVKASRLAFLQIDRKDVMFDDVVRTKGIMVQIDNHRYLEMKKTYRIENQEQQGGTLIGELFTQDELTNDKVLCVLRAYNYHQQKEGYLYIKDGDNAKFITNFNILPPTTIYNMMIMRDGKEWTTDNTIYPGETFNLRIEGISLSKVDFKIEELEEIKRDSVVRNDNVVEFRLRVPLTISKKNLAVYSNGLNTGRYLNVKEYQRPRTFDYLFVDYGNFSRCIGRLRGPEIYPHAIKNIIISYNADLIDTREKLYGKQYLDIEVRITGSQGQLIEVKEIENVCFAPGDNSPRYNYYDRSDCVKEDISLNNYLVNKINELPEWVKIQLTFKNKKEKMGGDGFIKVVEIVKQPYFRYDIDVSFPTLLFNRKDPNTGEPGFSYFGGVSMSMVAQFSFYDQNKINKFKPYRIGAGFLALNAFNFNPNNTARDVAAVVIASISPTQNTKIAAPLYFGFGYLFNGFKWQATDGNGNIRSGTQHWIWLVGPGIRVSF